MVTSTTFRASKLSPTEIEDARRLRARFESLRASGKTQAAFAEEFDVPGGAAMISQHIKEKRPISIDHAKAYMRGFNCDLRDISQALAEHVPKNSSLVSKKLQRQVDSLTNVLAAIPDDLRAEACIAALTELSKYLPHSASGANPAQQPPGQPKKPLE